LHLLLGFFIFYEQFRTQYFNKYQLFKKTLIFPINLNFALVLIL